ncbi:hypothetical protein F4805DRAFT_455074 [Annulohypoxylon moriforme]|nr:hypothetical protein F4805DRAFT_455074 [Annulohypoxylon moriforme]
MARGKGSAEPYVHPNYQPPYGTAPYKPPQRYPTDSSLYSCTDLEPEDDYRFLKASEVRRQVQAAPDKKQRLPPRPGSTSKRRVLSTYPETFRNLPEKLNLQAPKPHKEYPLTADPGQNWVEKVSGTADKVRAIYSPHDRSQFDVVYHNPKISQDTAKNFSPAYYRPYQSPAGGFRG